MRTIFSSIKRLIRKQRDKVYRLFRLKEIDYLSKYLPEDISIFSMNCFGGKVYQDLGREYTSPTAGLFFTAQDFNKIIGDINLLKQKVVFAQRADNEHIGGGYPVGRLEGTDIEIHFLHYNSDTEALEKWERRVSRFNFDNFIVIGFEQNGANSETIEEFSKIPIRNKVFFTVHDYKLPDTIYTPEFKGLKTHPDVVKYCNPIYCHLVEYLKNNPQ